MSSNNATMLANTPSEDNVEGEGLIQKDQLPPEVQCILGIFTNCINNAEIAAMLPAILHLNAESHFEDQELSRILEEHQMQEQKLEMLEWHMQESEGDKLAIIQLEEEIKNSFRDLLRFLRARPDTISNWKAELEEEMGMGERALIRELRTFENHIIEKWLSNKHEEPQLSPAKEVSTSDQDEEYILVMQCLAAEINQVDSKISDKNQEIENLQRSLEEKKQKANLLAKQHQSILETSDLTVQKIQQNVDEVSTQLKKLIRENRQSEKALQEKNSKLETDTEVLLQDFDDEIEEIQANLEQNEYKYEMELEELQKVESRIAALEEEYNGIVEKRRLAEEKKKEQERELMLKTRAALIAQAWWRGYVVRRAMRNKGKGKKDKKGKGKKKK